MRNGGNKFKLDKSFRSSNQCFDQRTWCVNVEIKGEESVMNTVWYGCVGVVCQLLLDTIIDSKS